MSPSANLFYNNIATQPNTLIKIQYLFSLHDSFSSTLTSLARKKGTQTLIYMNRSIENERK